MIIRSIARPRAAASELSPFFNRRSVCRVTAIPHISRFSHAAAAAAPVCPTLTFTTTTPLPPTRTFTRRINRYAKTVPLAPPITEKTRLTEYPIDDEILGYEYEQIHFIDENGKSQGFVDPRDVMGTYDRELYHLVLLNAETVKDWWEAHPDGWVPPPPVEVEGVGEGSEGEVAAAAPTPELPVEGMGGVEGIEGVEGKEAAEGEEGEAAEGEGDEGETAPEEVVPAGPPMPVCRLLEKAALLQDLINKREQLLQKKVKVPEKVVKELQVGWAISANDLAHRLKRLREFLDKGNKVEVMIAPKRKMAGVDPERLQEVLDAFKSTVEEAGGTEYKRMEGQIGGKVMLFFQGKLPGKSPKENEKEDKIQKARERREKRQQKQREEKAKRDTEQKK